MMDLAAEKHTGFERQPFERPQHRYFAKDLALNVLALEPIYQMKA
jgi:hypothetical protein